MLRNKFGEMIHFGDNTREDYLDHKNEKRRYKYYSRHYKKPLRTINNELIKGIR